MKKLLLFTVAIMGLAVFSASAKGSRPQNVRLRVTIHDYMSDNLTPAQVRSDGAGEYIDGVDGVSAQAGSDGNLTVSFWYTATTRNVWVNHDHIDGQVFSGPVGSPCNPAVYCPPSGYQYAPHMATSLPAPIPIQSMTIGSSWCSNIFWGFGPVPANNIGDVTARHDVFGIDSNTGYVVVTRTDATTWNVETPIGGTCMPGSPNPVAKVSHNVIAQGKGHTTTNTQIVDGYYYVPFHITLEQI